MKKLLLIIYLCSSLAFAQQLVVDTVAVLTSRLSGSSSLFYYDGRYWSANDHGTLTIYAIDTLTGAIIDSAAIHPVVSDMEEMHCDGSYIYLADIGNNTGSRRDLHFLRYPVTALTTDVAPDTIFFSYSDQTDFTPANMLTDFDCEAFVLADTSIYLFTKQWKSNASVVYSIPRKPGRYSAVPLDTIPVEGLVTGAVYQEQARLLTLCGYSNLMVPFLFVASGTDLANIASASFSQLDPGLPLYQTEAIATADGLAYYCTSEQLNYYIFSSSPTLFRISSESRLSVSESRAAQHDGNIVVSPNPAGSQIVVSGCVAGRRLTLYDISSRPLFSLTPFSDSCVIPTGGLADGVYLLHDSQGAVATVVIKH